METASERKRKGERERRARDKVWEIKLVGRVWMDEGRREKEGDNEVRQVFLVRSEIDVRGMREAPREQTPFKILTKS